MMESLFQECVKEEKEEKEKGETRILQGLQGEKSGKNRELIVWVRGYKQEIGKASFSKAIQSLLSNLFS